MAAVDLAKFRPASSDANHLRILIANEKLDRLGLLAAVVEGPRPRGNCPLGFGREVATTARERPDVALVGLGESSEHALELISEIVREAYCPVIAILSAYDACSTSRCRDGPVSTRCRRSNESHLTPK